MFLCFRAFLEEQEPLVTQNVTTIHHMISAQYRKKFPYLVSSPISVSGVSASGAFGFFRAQSFPFTAPIMLHHILPHI